MNINKEIISDFLMTQPKQVVENIDFNKMTIKYSSEIVNGRNIERISGEEELVRAIIITKLVNEFQYPISCIEIETTYEIGRPKVINPRADIIVRDKEGNAFLFIELKAPDKYDEELEDSIEKQLFNLACSEVGKGNTVNYLVYLTCDLLSNLSNKMIAINYQKFNNYQSWKETRFCSDELPIKYGKTIKRPFVKGSDKDLEKNYPDYIFQSIQNSLHNVLWGGGGTDDNEVFSSLVNIILAKIQDESEKEDGQCYDFQSFASANNEDEQYESNEELFDRLNKLYRRALKERMYVNDENRLAKSYVIDENKFSLSKLKYAVITLELYSLVDGKNSVGGKDILGGFFESIIRNGFKQSKGQFFTHTNVVTFILWALQLDRLAISRINRDKEIPYLIDPSAGSGTFLIEYMKFITENMKRRFRDKLSNSRDVQDKIETEWFYPDYRENRWAKTFIYGVEHNFNLGTASKVNMILHGDGSTNIFVKDGLLPFDSYTKETAPNALCISKEDLSYSRKHINGQFDVVVSNPPFSVDLDADTKTKLSDSFLFGDKKNSENLFIERYYHLLKEGGRMGIVLPESVFDVADNLYIRLFLFKYFNIKALISLPISTFAPYTPTKTSILLAQKKTVDEIDKWDKLWHQQSNIYSGLRTRCLNLIDVLDGKKQKNRLPSIKNLTPDQEKEILLSLLLSFITEEDKKFESTEIIKKYRNVLIDICKIDKDLKSVFGEVNTWWVFNQVSNILNYDIFMAEARQVGYKRTTRSEKKQPNDLYRVDDNNIVLIDDGIKETILDFVRDIDWK